jgi:hypothetical protein
MPVPPLSLSGSSPPITIMTYDILFHVFSINANMTNDDFWCSNPTNYGAEPSMDVTRDSSQFTDIGEHSFWNLQRFGRDSLISSFLNHARGIGERKFFRGVANAYSQ